MLPTLISKPFSSPDWLFEIKWDGIRCICILQDGKIELISRNLKNLSASYPEITSSASVIEARSAVIDGEIIALDENGMPNFQVLQKRISLINRSEILRYSSMQPVTLIAFDLLYLDGRDLTSIPLIERKKMLSSIISTADRIILSEFIEREGELFFQKAKTMGLEGVVAKKIQGAYRQGRSRDWLKIKTVKSQDCIICGYTEPKGLRKGFGSLLLGLFEKGKIAYVGHVGTGFSEELIGRIYSQITPLETSTCPFVKCPKVDVRTHWVEPKLVCEVRFAEWTNEGYLRQASFIKIRQDKDPKECLREIPSPAALVEKPGKVERVVNLRVGGRELTISNPDKVFWPQERLSKMDLVNYYLKLAKYIVPHLSDRPIVMKRYPEGIDGEYFFQKDASEYTPGWVKTVHLFSKSTEEYIDYILCNDEETLIYLVNLACIDQNHVLSRVGTLDKPDFVLFDLDPFRPAGFAETARVARSVSSALSGLGLKSFVKTSGATGIHILVPLQPIYSFKQVRDFAHLVAILLAREKPDLITLEREVNKRTDKVYIDYEQNVQGKSIASVYSARPFRGAPVSTPVNLDELTEDFIPSSFNIRNVPERVKEIGDIFEPVLTEKQRLDEAVGLLEKKIQNTTLGC